MDFSVIRPKPSPGKPDPPPPKTLPPHGKAPPLYGPFTPYMEELQRFWKMNFDEYPNQQQFGSSEYHNYPVGGGRGAHNHNPVPLQQLRMRQPPPHDLRQAIVGPPPRLDLPARDHHHRGPPTWFGPPGPDHHYEQPSSLQYGHAAPYYGGMFSDENPNGCMIM